MITLLTTVISFLTGGLPKLLDFFQDRGDKAHELAMAQLQFQQQLELQKAGFVAQKELEEVRLDEIKTQTDADIRISDNQTALGERVAIYNHDIEIGKGASRWVINLRAMVRPTITFGLYAIFLFVELFGCYYAVHSGESLEVVIRTLWNHDTQIIWASIVSFWFGTQAFKK